MHRAYLLIIFLFACSDIFNEDDNKNKKSVTISGRVTGLVEDIKIHVGEQSRILKADGNFSFKVTRNLDAHLIIEHLGESQMCGETNAAFTTKRDTKGILIKCVAMKTVADMAAEFPNKFTECLTETLDKTLLIKQVETVDCTDKGVDDLTGLYLLTNLQTLTLSANQLTAISLSDNPELTTINLSANRLEQISLSQNPKLKDVNIKKNQLHQIELSGLEKLTKLNLDDNNLTDIDLSKNTALTHLSLKSNHIAYINLDENKSLVGLDLRFSKLTDIDLSAQTELIYLDLGFNNLTNIDLSTNIKLINLDLESNSLTSINLDANKAIKALNIKSNNIPDETLSNDVKTKTKTKTLAETIEGEFIDIGNAIVDFFGG